MSEEALEKEDEGGGVIYGNPQKPYFVLHNYNCMICEAKIGQKEEHRRPFCDKCSAMMGFFMAPFNKKV